MFPNIGGVITVTSRDFHPCNIFLINFTGYCFWAISFFLSFFVYLFLFQQHYEKTAGSICMKFSGKAWSDHETTWFNFGSIRVNESAGRLSSCLLSPAIAQSQLHSLGGSRGLALTSQLHRWQQGAGFVVPRTTACSVLKSTEFPWAGDTGSAVVHATAG